MTAPTKTIVVIDPREHVIASSLRDIVSFGGLIGSAYALNALMPPSGWLNAALAISWILWLASKGARRAMKMTPEEARAWLDDQHPSPALNDNCGLGGR